MKFLVIEGVDGSGKSTQIKLIQHHLDEHSIPYRFVHFPRTDTGIYGDLIARFLRGDLGDLKQVNPYLVALIYAGDRKDAADMIQQWLNEGYLVLLDRYVYSNIAFQCAKISDPVKQKELCEWILELEYGYFKIPKPDLNILLNVPFSFTEKKLAETRTGDERNYLQGARDIHEEDLLFQKKVREMYLWLAAENQELKIINCTSEHGDIQKPELIFTEILRNLELKPS